MRLFNDILEQVKSVLGNGETYGNQLLDYCKKYANIKGFIGVYPQDVTLPPKSKNCCYILNKSLSSGSGEHWVAIFQENGNIYCFDSFGRAIDRILPVFDKNAGGGVIYNDDIMQKDSQSDCGQRSIAFLILASKYGIKNAIKI